MSSESMPEKKEKLNKQINKKHKPTPQTKAKQNKDN